MCRGGELELENRGNNELDCAPAGAWLSDAKMKTMPAIPNLPTRWLQSINGNHCWRLGRLRANEFVFCVPIGKVTPVKT